MGTGKFNGWGIIEIKNYLCVFFQNGAFGPSSAQTLLSRFGAEVSDILDGLMQNCCNRTKVCGLSGCLRNHCQSHRNYQVCPHFLG